MRIFLIRYFCQNYFVQSNNTTQPRPLNVSHGMEGYLCRHVFSDMEQLQLRSKLLRWYEKNKRELPWRSMVGGLCTNCAAVCARFNSAGNRRRRRRYSCIWCACVGSNVTAGEFSTMSCFALLFASVVCFQNADIAVITYQIACVHPLL